MESEYTLKNISTHLKEDKFKGYYLYAIYRKKCLFQKIEKEFSLSNCYGEALEIHIFDSKEEYRYVKSKINKGDRFILIKDSDDMNIFKDYMYFGNNRVEVINYYTFDNGMIKFENYRLSVDESK